MITGLYLFLGVYIFINTLISIYVYLKSKPFYRPYYISTGEDFEKRKECLHEKNKEFKKNDQLSFLRIFIGVNLLFWVKFILLIIDAACLLVILL